ncbi:hypothetical protein, partial [Desulfogranum marinum]|uniref:hypothetical protein n=1 Tax=Desulfogranum marinum TaxID=453220 RepID=UPI0019622DC3
MTNSTNDILSIPLNVGRRIVEDEAVIAKPLLGTSVFLQFCKERNVNVSAERLLCFERLGLFSPVFRVRSPEQELDPFRVPIQKGNNWFELGYAWDTTTIPENPKVPDLNDDSYEAYYSIFQIFYLNILLKTFTLQLSLESYLEGKASSPTDVEIQFANWIEYAEERKKSLVNTQLSGLPHFAVLPFKTAVHAWCEFSISTAVPMITSIIDEIICSENSPVDRIASMTRANRRFIDSSRL